MTRAEVNIKTISFYEMKPLPAVGLVVEPGDADPSVPHAGLYPLDDDHRTICTPKSKQAVIHLKTISFVRECLDFDDAHRVSSESATQWASQPFDVSNPWNVPYPRNEFFTGRDQVVTDIRNQLTKRRRAVLIQTISGLGGIGKTQTAVEYAYRYRDKYKAVFWLNAESTLDLKAGYGELARLMRLIQPENDLDQAVLALKQWLTTEGGWLLVFDNADQPAALKPFLLDGARGHILVTSRAQDFQDLGIINPVELEKLPIEDATAFLLKRCGRDAAEADERDAAEQLARELDGLPLALEQAAAYIVAGNGLKFERYLEGYRTGGLTRLEASRPALGNTPDRWSAPGPPTSRRSSENHWPPPMCCGSVLSSPRTPSRSCS